MTVTEFSDKYGIDKASLYVGINQKWLPKSILIPTDRGYNNVDEQWFLRRLKFKKDVELYCHDMYYLIMHSGLTSEMKLAKVTGISQPWFRDGLFSFHRGSITRFKVSPAMWKFFRFCRRLERVLSRKYNIQFDIEKILDEEAKICETKETSKMMNISRLISTNEIKNLSKAG